MKKYLYRSIFVTVLILAAFLIYQNAAVIGRMVDVMKKEQVSDKTELSDVYNKLIVLQREVNDLKTSTQAQIGAEEIARLTAQYEEVKKQNLNTIDSKADVALVLGLLQRMDKVEAGFDKVSKVSNDGALVMSAAMLVKERADCGESFVYEANVLELLAESKPEYKHAVEVIKALAVEGIVSDMYLMNSFRELDKGSIVASEDVGLSWKERIKSKLHDIVRIKKTNEAEASNEVVVENVEAKAKAYVEAGMFGKAGEVLQGNAKYAEWLKLAKNKAEFNEAISNIASYSLAVMKVDNLK